MKRIIKQLIVPMLIIVFMCFTARETVRGAENLLAEFNYSSSGKVTGDKLVEYGDKDGYNPTQGRGTLLCYMDSSESRALEWSDPEYNNNGENIVPIVRASMKNKWGSTPSFLVTLSTKGYTSIKFSAKMGGSSNGPAQWKLQYSIDGSNFTDVQSSGITIPFDTRKTMTQYYDGFALPGEASDRDLLYIRIISSSTATVVGGNYLELPFGGETAINNIRVVGTDIASMTTTPAPTTTQKAPEVTTAPKATTGTQSQTTSKPSGGGTGLTTKSGGNGGNTSEGGNGGSTQQVTTSQSSGAVPNNNQEVSTHVVTQTNAAGETVTSIVYDETTEAVTDENGETITEKESDSTEESAGEEAEKNNKSVKKKKTASSGNVESETEKAAKKGNSQIIVIAVLVAVLAAGIGAAVIIQRKKNSVNDENKG